LAREDGAARYDPDMATFILKTEPDAYSYEDLASDGKAVWDGITNNAALAHLRSAKVGDEAMIYHTGETKAIVGLAKITRAAYADPKQPGTTAKGEPKFAVIEIKPLRAVKSPVTLAQLNADKRFAEFPLVTQGRLSVVPVPASLDAIIRKMAGL
jgi:predicted RNA-binding protein with PUA-like domain